MQRYTFRRVEDLRNWDFMKKQIWLQIKAVIDMMAEEHSEMINSLQSGDYQAVRAMLEDCQDAAIGIGQAIEESVGEETESVKRLEAYCEVVYRLHEGLSYGTDSIRLDELSIAYNQFRTVFATEIHPKKEIVFVPYKASMWDSLESIWMAADADPECNAVVIPVPYYDRNPDGTTGAEHYEVEQFPEYVPVTFYGAYDFKNIHPDAIYFHNPYDEYNFVTTIHPYYYSKNLREFTNMLIYVPYFASAGGMSEGQSLLPAYVYADYVVIQAERFKGFYDPIIPREKFLVMGSPKFDRVIRLCQNPPEAPEEWKPMLDGRRVYFFNTSLGGMLGNTPAFFNKMEYVFNTFEGRNDVCLLWRPHPLFEETLGSIRSEYLDRYYALRDRFVNEKIGILDTTSDIETTIALCDCYIGDSGTSVTSLFGVAGKPVFILDNYINAKPSDNDWRGAFISPMLGDGSDNRFMVTKNNILWYSPNADYQYEYYMTLCEEYSDGSYYCGAVQYGAKIYVIPRSAQKILIVNNRKIVGEIPFKNPIAHGNAFYGYQQIESKLYIFPFLYDSLVIFDMDTEEIQYVEGIGEYTVKDINGEKRIGGHLLFKGEMIFANPMENRLLFLNLETLTKKEASIELGGSDIHGILCVFPYGDDLLLLPNEGMSVIKWNPVSGEYREYSNWPEELKCIKWPLNIEVREMPFSSAITVRDDVVILSPGAGNLMVALNPITGEAVAMKTDRQLDIRGINGYYPSGGMGNLVFDQEIEFAGVVKFWYAPERRLYEIRLSDIDVNNRYFSMTELQIELPVEDLINLEPGFKVHSEWLGYSCSENAFNSLENLIDNDIHGDEHDRAKQLKSYRNVNVSPDGDCGDKLHQYIMNIIAY